MLAGRWLLATVTVVFVLRLLLALAVIPPWQAPDEPTHLLLVRILAGQTTPDLSRRTGLAIEGEVVASMAEHGWWRHYGRLTPDPLPRDLTDAGLTVVDSGPISYYVSTAAVFRSLGVESLQAQFDALRRLSAVFGVLTLWCAWAGTRRLFGPSVADLSAAVIAIHPQFALVSTSVGPGAVVSFFGAMVWWQGAVVLTAGRLSAAALLWASAALGALAKRDGLPLVVMAAVITSLGLLRGIHPARFGARALMAASLAVGLAAVGAVLAADEVSRIVDTLPLLLFDRSLDPESATWAYFGRFSLLLVDSAWLFAGWMRYPAPPLWVLTVRVLMALSAGGLLILAWQHRRRLSTVWTPPYGIWLPLVLVAIQVSAIYAVHFRLNVSPQGRYLFSVIAPMVVVFWIGLRSWWPRRAWPLVAGGLVAALLLLDVVGWSALLIPLYVG